MCSVCSPVHRFPSVSHPAPRPDMNKFVLPINVTLGVLPVPHPRLHAETFIQKEVEEIKQHEIDGVKHPLRN